MIRFLLLTLCCALLVSALVIVSPVSAASSRSEVPAPGRIAFVAIENDAPAGYSLHIMTIDPDGSDVRKLASLDFVGETNTYIWADQGYLTWSSDYQHLMFVDDDILHRGERTARTVIVRATGEKARTYGFDYCQFKWSPDGKYLAYLYRENRRSDEVGGELYLADSDGGNPQRYTDRMVTDFDWNPDGSQIALSSQGDIYVTPTQGPPKLKRLTTNDLEVNEIRWSPDGARIGYMYRLMLYVVDVRTQNRQKVSSALSSIGYRWSPDGHKLIDHKSVIDVVKGAAIPIPYPDDSYSYYKTILKWSPDGSKLLFSMRKNQNGRWIHIWDLATSALVKLNIPGDTPDWMNINEGVWSPDGKQIAYVLGRQICVTNTDNTDPHCFDTFKLYESVGNLQWVFEPG